MDNMYERLNEIFQDIFDDPSITVNADTVAKDIEGWDSLANINIIVSVEDVFGMKFDMDEIVNMKCVGEMVKIISERATK